MPSTYYAPPNTTTDEAAWLFDADTAGTHQNDSAIELGWFQGYWPYAGEGYGQNFAYPQGYDTFNNGAYGNIVTGALPPSDQLQFYISGAGGGIVGGTTLNIYNVSTGIYYYTTSSTYYVTYPRTNFSQGEVAGGQGAWMGGNNGGGTTSYGYSQPGGQSTFYPWTGFGECDNAPYFITQLSANSWKNGGS